MKILTCEILIMRNNKYTPNSGVENFYQILKYVI